MSGALDGLRVIEIAGLGPTPSCGMLLADMGAEVLRIDRIEKSDLGIEIPTRFNLRDRNKKSVAIDLKAPDGISILRNLIAQADVLIEGFRPGVAERLGFGPDDCIKIRPNLVYARATGWGQIGPLSQSAGHDINYIAITGALDLIGEKDRDPVVPLNLLGDYAGGAAYLAFGIMCGVFEARKSGKGQVVDGAIVDGVTGLLTMFHAMRQSGELQPNRGSNVLDGGAPFYSTYRTKDAKYVAIGALEGKFYAALIRGLGLDLTQLPDRNERANWPKLREIMSGIFNQKTREEWVEVFQDIPDACFSPVLSLVEAGHHPQNKARKAFQEFDGLVHPAPAPRLSRTPGSIDSPPPRIGEHTATALKEWGIGESAIERGLYVGALMDASAN